MATARAGGRASERLRDVQAITEAALAHLSQADLLDELLDRVRGILGADRMALAIEHLRLYEAERDARERAERTVEQIRQLQSVTDVALGNFAHPQELMVRLLERVRDVLHADTAAILLREGDELVARAAKGLEEEVERGVRIPFGRGFAGRVAAECRPVSLPHVDHADVLNPTLSERGIRSLLG